LATSDKNFKVKNGLDVNGEITASAIGGDEGGQLNLAKPQTNTTLSGDVAIDIHQNKLRIFDKGGSNRGAYIDLTAASTGVGSNLLSGGGVSPSEAQGYADTAESNSTAYTDLLIGDATVDGTGGNTVTNRIASAVSALVDASPSTLNTLNELAAALNDDPSFATTISTSIGTKVSKAGDTMTGDLYLPHSPTAALQAATKQYVDDQVSQAVSDLEGADGEILEDISTINTSLGNKQDKVADVSDIEIGYLNGVTSAIQTQLENKQDIVGDVSNTEIGYLNGVTSAIQTQINNKQDKVADVSDSEIAQLNGVTSPIQTQLDNKQNRVADVSDNEIGHLNGVTSPIQTQLDAKLDSGTASGIYAPLNDPTFGGTVSLPGTTSIGDISSTELGYLNGVTSSIQTQLTDLDTTKADLESPTFTGTVSGITSSMVGLGSVDNTSDLNKPVSTAQQTALDAKLNLSGGTMTGKITLDGDPTQALHAVTKQYVDSVEGGLLTRPQVRAATTSNLAADYSNGTLGVGATLTSTSNGAFPLIDDVALTTVNGSRGILVKSQTNAAHNGRYNLTTQGDSETPWVLTRCGLCDEADEIPGSYIFVTDGTLNGQTGWVQHVDDPATFTVGTDDIEIYQFAGAGSTLTAGTNISVSGSQVSVIDAPIFSGIVDASASGVEFSDGVQTKAGVPTLTTFVEKTASYTLDTLVHQDNVIEMNSTSPMTFTIPTNAALAWPVGASMDILQTNTGEVTIAASGGVTLNRTPGNKLRTQWSSATILKRGTNSWILYGDLKA
jgi:hypothetical protein